MDLIDCMILAVEVGAVDSDPLFTPFPSHPPPTPPALPAPKADFFFKKASGTLRLSNKHNEDKLVESQAALQAEQNGCWCQI